MIRPYRAADRDACLALFDSNVPTAFQEWERPGFESFLDDLPGLFLVMEDESGMVVGCGGVAAEDDHTGSLCWGIVHPDRHGEGLGRRLLLARVAALRSEGYASARLETIPRTTGFFEKAGFEITEVEADGYGTGLDRVVMRMEVSRA